MPNSRAWYYRRNQGLQFEVGAVTKLRSLLVAEGSVELADVPGGIQLSAVESVPRRVFSHEKDVVGLDSWITHWLVAGGTLLGELFSESQYGGGDELAEFDGLLHGNLRLRQPPGAICTNESDQATQAADSCDETEESYTSPATSPHKAHVHGSGSHFILLEASKLSKKVFTEGSDVLFDKLLRFERRLGLLRTRHAIYELLRSDACPFALTETPEGKEQWVKNSAAADGADTTTAVIPMDVRMWIIDNIRSVARPVTDIIAMMVMIVPDGVEKLTASALRKLLENFPDVFPHARALHYMSRFSVFGLQKEDWASSVPARPSAGSSQSGSSKATTRNIATAIESIYQVERDRLVKALDEEKADRKQAEAELRRQMESDRKQAEAELRRQMESDRKQAEAELRRQMEAVRTRFEQALFAQGRAEAQVEELRAQLQQRAEAAVKSPGS